MNYDTKLENFSYAKDECKVFLDKYPKYRKKEKSQIRVKVLSSDVKEYNGKLPMEYRVLMNRYVFEDHRVFLRIGQKCIGFMVSPYNIHSERHKALQLDGHSVFEIRQQHHINAETLVVIKNEYVNCILWKVFEIVEPN